MTEHLTPDQARAFLVAEGWTETDNSWGTGNVPLSQRARDESQAVPEMSVLVEIDHGEAFLYGFESTTGNGVASLDAPTLRAFAVLCEEDAARP